VFSKASIGSLTEGEDSLTEGSLSKGTATISLELAPAAVSEELAAKTLVGSPLLTLTLVFLTLVFLTLVFEEAHWGIMAIAIANNGNHAGLGVDTEASWNFCFFAIAIN